MRSRRIEGRCDFDAGRRAYLPIYERQPHESEPRWEGFKLYLQERSGRRVAARLGKSAALVHKWSKEDRWPARARAWTEEQERIQRALVLAEYRRMSERHAAAASKAIAALLAPLEAISRPRLLVDEQGRQILNEDGVPITIERGADLDAADTQTLLALIAQTARVLAPLVAIERLARGPEPSAETPAEEAPDVVEVPSDSDRAAAVLAALEEVGIVNGR